MNLCPLSYCFLLKGYQVHIISTLRLHLLPYLLKSMPSISTEHFLRLAHFLQLRFVHFGIIQHRTLFECVPAFVKKYKYFGFILSVFKIYILALSNTISYDPIPVRIEGRSVI